MRVKIKMKRCIKCETLLSNYSKLCNKCGSRELERGSYNDEPYKEVIHNKYIEDKTKGTFSTCPTCAGPIYIKEGFNRCDICDEEFVSFGSDIY